MEHQHITATRAWQLIRDHTPLDATETQHVRHCEECNSFLMTFFRLSIAAGFNVLIEIPEYEGPEEREHSA
jgi:hypothetical protein